MGSSICIWLGFCLGFLDLFFLILGLGFWCVCGIPILREFSGLGFWVVGSCAWVLDFMIANLTCW